MGAAEMSAYYADDHLTVYQGDCRAVLAELPAESVHCVVTSPPYWGLRDYGDPGQLGLEPTPEEYVANMVAVFRPVSRVLRADGTVWLNLGDSYAVTRAGAAYGWTNGQTSTRDAETMAAYKSPGLPPGLKPKDLVGIPWRVAFALQADGWYLRSDIIWAKPNPMPESVTDRPTKAHEYLFLLTKSARYYYDADAVRETSTGRTDVGRMSFRAEIGAGGVWKDEERTGDVSARNLRTVWTKLINPIPLPIEIFWRKIFSTISGEIFATCSGGAPDRVLSKMAAKALADIPEGFSTAKPPSKKY
jgi:hypothetical protein